LVLGQAKINENIIKKLMSNDKMLENINSQKESLSSAVKNQLSFNKMIETQISQIAITIPRNHSRKPQGNLRILVKMIMQLQINEGGKVLSDKPKTSNPCRR
jgi:hypothetical protein